MRIIDISQQIHTSMPVYPGDPVFESAAVNAFRFGDDYELSKLTMGTHCGTHIDAPSHMIPDGETIEQIPLDRYLGPCRIVQCPDGGVKRSILESIDIRAGERILLRTDPSGEYLDRGEMNPAALDPDAARYLAQQGAALVGIDSPSIENMEITSGEVHRVLLNGGVAILEGLDMRAVEEEEGFLCALPLKLQGENGSPCRAVIILE